MILAAVLVGGCGGSDHPKPVVRAPSPSLALADCNLWHELRPGSRRALVEQMTIFFGARADNGQPGQTLTVDQAFRVLTDGCRPAYAGAVKLYKLYGRAAAFTP